MNPQDFLDLLDGLPDEMLCDANDAPRIQPRRLRYMLSALAACAVLVIAAGLWLVSSLFLRVRAALLMKKVLPPFLVAFTTASSMSAMPLGRRYARRSSG